MNTYQPPLTLLVGDCREVLATLPDESVQCCVTSPPYWGLRDYGHAGQIGQEATPEEFVQTMVEVFREVRRVLKSDGTFWLNLGDSYASTTKGSGGTGKSTLGAASGGHGISPEGIARSQARQSMAARKVSCGLADKQLVGIPWRVALALQADGWYLRQDIIWHKPNPMPESVTDRCTKAHEYIFLLTKSAKYFYDHEAVKDAVTSDRAPSRKAKKGGAGRAELRPAGTPYDGTGDTRNKRSVWTVPTKPYAEAHFATYPPDLIRPCILAGTRPGDTVLDPFGGSGTTGQVALEHGRRAILIELNPQYAEIAEGRTSVTLGLGI